MASTVDDVALSSLQVEKGKHSVATVDDVEKMKVHSHAWVVAYLQLH